MPHSFLSPGYLTSYLKDFEKNKKLKIYLMIITAYTNTISAFHLSRISSLYYLIKIVFLNSSKLSFAQGVNFN